MKTTAIWAAAAVIAAALGIHGSCLAGETAVPGAQKIIGELAGTVVPAAELNSQHARGSTNINVKAIAAGAGASFDEGALHGNSVIGSSATGLITTTNSINNNTGITTVFQNSGNNSLFQQSTAINITLH
jgi:hypothetical protein